jgi:hypothetical protein
LAARPERHPCAWRLGIVVCRVQGIFLCGAGWLDRDREEARLDGVAFSVRRSGSAPMFLSALSRTLALRTCRTFELTLETRRIRLYLLYWTAMVLVYDCILYLSTWRVIFVSVLLWSMSSLACSVTGIHWLRVKSDAAVGWSTPTSRPVDVPPDSMVTRRTRRRFPAPTLRGSSQMRRM